MAKKASARRKDEAADEGFANNKYADERIAATFDYNELCLARASELLAPRLRAGLTVATFAALLGVIFIASVARDQLVLLVILFFAAFALLQAMQNVSKLKLRFARSTNLSPEAASPRYRAVICGDAVHLENSEGGVEDFSLIDLRRVHESPDSILACFTDKRYVYLPRSAFSEGRFRETSRILNESLKK